MIFENGTNPPEKLPLLFELDRVFDGQGNIDLVVINDQTNFILRHEILTQGKPLFEATPFVFSKEGFKAMCFYEDSKPFFEKFHSDYMKRTERELKR